MDSSLPPPLLTPDLRPLRMSSDVRNAVLQLVNGPGYKPVKPAIIAKRLGLVDDGAQQVKRAVRLLVKEKLLGLRAEPSGDGRRQEAAPRHGERRRTLH